MVAMQEEAPGADGRRVKTRRKRGASLEGQEVTPGRGWVHIANSRDPPGREAGAGPEWRPD